MQAEFDQVESVWRFRSERAPSGAPLAAVLHGIGWTADCWDPREPLLVEVGHPASEFTRAAVAILLGPEARSVLDQPAPEATGDEPVVVRTVETGDDAAPRRAAMGLLALALTAAADHPLRALDTAALLRRAGLDGSEVVVGGRPERAALPAAADLADDADEALEMVLAAGPAPFAPAGGSTEVADEARRALDDARRFIAVTTGELLSGIDVEASFAAIAVTLGGGDGGDEPPAKERRRPVYLGGDEPTAGTDLPVRLADPLIRGVAAVRAVHTDGVTVVEVTVRPGAGEVAVRAIGASGEAVAGEPLTPTDDPLVLRAALASGEAPLRVEVVRSRQQPVAAAAGADAAHRAAVTGEAQRVLAQLALTGDDGAADRRALVERLRGEVRRSLAALPLPPTPGPDGATLIPLPSAAVQAAVADQSDAVRRHVEAVGEGAVRAIRADEVAALLEGCVLPWAQTLLGSIRLIEAEARTDGGWGEPLDAAARAVLAFAAADDPDGVQRARDFVRRNG